MNEGRRACRRRFGALVSALVAAALCPDAAIADAFCDTLRTITAEAPNFEALKGKEFVPGAAVPDHYGTVSFAGVHQCVVRDEGYGPKGDSDYGTDPHYECVWDNIAPAGLDWLKNEVKACYSEASYVDGLKNGTGGVFTIGSATLEVEYADYGSLWISVR